MNGTQRFIVTTCGTSLLTNMASGHTRRLITKYANARNTQEIGTDFKEIDALVESCHKKLGEESIQEICNFSAELNGLIKLYGYQFPHSNDQHCLLVTDTWLGRKTAELIEAWLRNHGQYSVQQRQLQDLRTDSLKEFQVAMSELVCWCDETLSGYRDKGWRVIFNLTGGFKSVQGFLQTLALFYADEAVYVFQSSGELLRLPRLPVRLEVNEVLEKHLAEFRRMARQLRVTDQEAATIPHTLLWIDEGCATLSPWGELVWNQGYRDLYRKRLWDSPSPKIRYDPKFVDSRKELAGGRLQIINERIDDLAVKVETGRSLSRLDLKPLKGDPRPPSTHEIDAWSDQDAKRIYGHYEDDVFVLDALGKALH